jgi:hypothetical protein
MAEYNSAQWNVTNGTTAPGDETVTDRSQRIRSGNDNDGHCGAPQWSDFHNDCRAG